MAKRCRHGNRNFTIFLRAWGRWLVRKKLPVALTLMLLIAILLIDPASWSSSVTACVYEEGYAVRLVQDIHDVLEALANVTAKVQCMQQILPHLRNQTQLADQVEYHRRRTENTFTYMYYGISRQLLSLVKDKDVCTLSGCNSLLAYAVFDYGEYIGASKRELVSFNSVIDALHSTTSVGLQVAVQRCVCGKVDGPSDRLISMDVIGDFANISSDSTNFAYAHNATIVEWLVMKLRTKQVVQADDVKPFLDSFTSQYKAIASYLHHWNVFTKVLMDREHRIWWLSNAVSKHLNTVQYPQSCSKSRKLICQLSKNAGFASEVKRTLYCFLLALASGRVLQIDSAGMLNGIGSWEMNFVEPTNCTQLSAKSSILSDRTKNDFSVRIVFYSYKHPIYEPQYRPRTVPSEIVEEVSALHGDPFEWLSGQMVSFLLRMRPEVERKVMGAVDALQITYPTIGMHIRRTDKSSEVSLHTIKEYFDIAELYYRQLEQTKHTEYSNARGNATRDQNGKVLRRVYLATDDPKVIKEAKHQFPHYTIIADYYRSGNGGLKERYSSNGLFAALIDIYALSRTDFVICTMSSNFCALVYSLKQTALEDASTSVFSLDTDWWSAKNFNQKDRKFKAVYAQQADYERGVIEMVPGDIIKVKNLESFGLAKGYNTRTRKTGLLYRFKVEEIIDSFAFNFSRRD